MGIKILTGHYADYTDGKRLKRLAVRVVESTRHIDFDSIAVCGISGLLVGAPLAVETGKNLVIVRKPNEPTRTMEQAASLGASMVDFGVCGSGDNRKILLLDDHIASGTTLKFMVSSINRQCANPIFSGVLLYHQPGWYRLVVGNPESFTLTDAKGEKVTIPILSLS